MRIHLFCSTFIFGLIALTFAEVELPSNEYETEPEKYITAAVGKVVYYNRETNYGLIAPRFDYENDFYRHLVPFQRDFDLIPDFPEKVEIYGEQVVFDAQPINYRGFLKAVNVRLYGEVPLPFVIINDSDINIDPDTNPGGPLDVLP